MAHPPVEAALRHGHRPKIDQMSLDRYENVNADLQVEYAPLMNSACMRRINAMVSRVAPTDVTVLILGDTGVGKELVARTLHLRSRRRDGPFVKINCAALPVDLLESELFGYERGAFTGADHRKAGKFEQAHRGSIFLDEIGEMPLSVQAKLLQVLQDQQFARLGGEQEIQVDVRVIAATNRDLGPYVAHGGFREDLFHRLNVVNIRVPALRERPEEIPVLIEYFLAVYRHKHGAGPRQLSRATLERLGQYTWPGNVRELENIIQRIVVLGTEMVLTELEERKRRPSRNDPDGAAASTSPDIADHVVGLKELARQTAKATEQAVLKRTLRQVQWRRVAAARRLGISYKTLLDKIKQYGLDLADS
jgi:two-component system, NtrC family, response regulator AtoC